MIESGAREMTGMSIERVLLMGNEAIARGALEGGVAYATGYPGNPSSEILEAMFSFQKEHRIRVEWSVNEIVALEAAAAFAFCGLRSMVTMKQNGLNVAADFLTTVCLNHLRGGMVVAVCDDPGPMTSSNEQDSRHFAKIAQVPLLEPSTSNEAKEMMKWLLGFSEEVGVPCILRSVSRLSHGRGGVTLGEIRRRDAPPFFDTSKPLVGLPFLVTIHHAALLKKMSRIREIFDESPFNGYAGPQAAPFVIMATGLGALYAREAVKALRLEEAIGILKIGTVWPLPKGMVQRYLRQAEAVLFVEEVDPFLEDQVKILYSEHASELAPVRFYGKNTGDIGGPNGPGVGEMNSDIVREALERIFRRPPSCTPNPKIKEAAQWLVPRELSFCGGCPHRASFYAIKVALDLDGRNGFVVGDIGCYGLAAGATGFNQIKMLHCMGSGMGNLSGFSALGSFGFDQPVIGVVGDSTFFHAGLPALVNAMFNRANGLFIVLDNAVTAMTGFQVNPASPFTALGEATPPLRAEDIARSVGARTTVLDPVEDIQSAIDAVCAALQEEGVKVIVFRRACATFEKKAKDTGRSLKARVDPERCVGEACGCNRFCSRVLACPSVEYDKEEGKAFINEDTCNGCGFCRQLCFRQAISLIDLQEEMKTP
jgi:indolepyruvate ferredoxin oxidoreductase alpha subunit